MRLVLLAVAVLLAGCGDPRCSPEGYAVLSTCRAQHYLTPSSFKCRGFLDADGGLAALSRDQFIEACNRFSLGHVVQCAQEESVSCAMTTEGGRAAFIGCVERRTPAWDREVDVQRACANDCFKARSTCDNGCSMPVSMTCSACVMSCAVVHEACYRACPIDR